MRKQFTMTQEEMDHILEINKKGGDPVMYLSGGVLLGQSLQEKINDYWAVLGKKYGFQPLTAGPGSDGHLSFTAEEV